MAIGETKEQMIRQPLTDVDVLIVGAGLAGLYFAIECYRQGHSPRIVESKSGVELLGESPFHSVLAHRSITDSLPIGDFVGIGTSATRQFKKWPGMAETYSSIVYRPAMNMYTAEGVFVGGPFELSEESHYRPVPVSRPKLITALYDYAISLGILVTFGHRVVDYEESSNANRAWAITDRGTRFEADAVVAADGIGTRSGKIMASKDAKAISSGWSVYRVTYPTKILQEDPVLAKRYLLREGDPDYCQVFMSSKGQVIILVSPELVTWLFTHEVSLLFSLTS
jgi:2-polyprenyl-6-methoxyphenol hydroxylase-like FAD-dependent oxidoreductase